MRLMTSKTSQFEELKVTSEEGIPNLIEKIDIYGTVNQPYPSATKEQVQQVLDALLFSEAQILIRWFGLNDNPPQTFEEIGKEVGVTRECIRQIKVRALKKIHHPRLSRILYGNRTSELYT
jgi:DNA-directed RNA polymerase sigma subunit (sigma70/sigma32)